MRNPFRMMTALLASLFLAFGMVHADQHQQNQQDGDQQRQQTQQRDFGFDGQSAQSMDRALDELRQIHERLGQIINALEGQTQLGDRIGRLEQEARADALREARRGLQTLQQDIEAGEQPDETAREVGNVRRDLSRAFSDVRGEDRQRFTELEDQFTTLEEQVRAGEENVTQTYQTVLDRLDEELERGRQQFERQTRQRTVTDARSRLQNLRGDIEAGRNAERVADDIAEIRQNLDRSFRGVDPDEREQFDQFAEDLNTLEEQVRAGDEQAADTFDELMQRFDRDFGPYTQPGDMNGGQDQRDQQDGAAGE